MKVTMEQVNNFLINPSNKPGKLAIKLDFFKVKIERRIKNLRLPFNKEMFLDYHLTYFFANLYRTHWFISCFLKDFKLKILTNEVNKYLKNKNDSIYEIQENDSYNYKNLNGLKIVKPDELWLIEFKSIKKSYENGEKLPNNWVQKQRYNFNNEILLTGEIILLNQLDSRILNPINRTNSFDYNVEELKKFCNREKCYPKVSGKKKDENKLARWLKKIYNNSLDEENRTILDNILSKYVKVQKEEIEKPKTIKGKTKEEHIIDFKDKHGNKYCYSLVTDNIKSTDKIFIICNECNITFQQTVKNHKTSKIPCPDCLKKYQAKKASGNTESFIIKAISIHGDSYDYSSTYYEHSEKNIDIYCKKCNKTFSQKPRIHLEGKGCTNCSKRGFDISKPGILYYLKISGKYYKIGITNKSVEERFTAKDLKKIEPIFIKKFDIGKYALEEEQKILKKFKGDLYKGKKILSSGNTEIFNRDVLGVA